MRLRIGRRLVPWLPLGIALSIGGPMSATAQAPPDPAPPDQVRLAQASGTPTPALPAPTVPPGAVPAAASMAAYEARIQQLEAMVRELQAQQAVLMQRSGVASPDSGTVVGAPGATLGQPGASGMTPSAMGGDIGTVVGAPGAPIGEPGASAITPSQSGGASAPGQSFPPNPAPSNRFDSPATLANLSGSVKFGPGFEIRTDDEEFFFQFHNLTQVDYRGYQQGGQNPVHDTFTMPRQWFMFSGRLTRPIGYFVSLANGFDTVTMLDCFVDLNYDPRIQGRIGRFKTPFTYEFLVEPPQGLILPERSVFFNNFGLNRDLGAMAYGRLWEPGLLDYAFGVFNGNRNGYVALQDGKFISGYANLRPFFRSEGSLLENFDVGGSFFGGDANHAPVPAQLRTVVAITGNQVNGVPFLTFNNNVLERGAQMFWDLHMAYYYRGLAVIGEWASGFQEYGLTSNAQRTKVPVESFYVQFGYLLTGETRSTIGIVKPLHPFDLQKGKRGWGAWELVGRVQYLDIGNQVFTTGLSDPNNSANRLWGTDVGFNWHMTQYLKLYFDWEHVEFNQPVIFAPGRRQLTSDLFLVRLQLNF
jgi:phosphate-selective porin OprO/OprP